MIIANGILQIIGKTGGGYKNGKPVPVETTTGEPIPCNITTNKYDRLGTYIDGKFTRASFIILIDMQSFDADRVTLTTDRGKVLGEYSVQNIQFLDVVENVKITV